MLKDATLQPVSFMTDIGIMERKTRPFVTVVSKVHDSLRYALDSIPKKGQNCSGKWSVKLSVFSIDVLVTYFDY